MLTSLTTHRAILNLSSTPAKWEIFFAEEQQEMTEVVNQDVIDL